MRCCRWMTPEMAKARGLVKGSEHPVLVPVVPAGAIGGGSCRLTYCSDL